jgi:type IV pilus assembly protein PilX
MSPAAFHRRTPRPAGAHRLPRAQQGVILIITLIILAAMTLASLAMLNSVDTSTSIAGNVSFKQSATNSADKAIDAAGVFLTVSKQNTESDSPSSGYYATSQDNFDITGNKTPGDTSDDLDWTGAGIVTMAKDGAGNTVSYRINRMCDATGALNAATCAVKITETGSKPPSLGIVQPTSTYQQRAGGNTQVMSGYYRITMRIAGPRNNVSYVQTVVNVQ